MAIRVKNIFKTSYNKIFEMIRSRLDEVGEDGIMKELEQRGIYSGVCQLDMNIDGQDIVVRAFYEIKDIT